MAFAKNGDVRLHWRQDGSGPPLLLLNSIGCDLSLWDGVIPYLSGLRVLRMHARGHGESDVPPGDYTLDQLAQDAVSVLDAAGVAKTVVCGLSLGGMTAMALALAAPNRISALILACTSAKMDRNVWDTRIAAVRSGGMAGIADTVMARFFSDTFRRDHPKAVEKIRARLLKMDAQGYARCGAAIRDMDLIDRISAIRAPTLIVAGTQDVSTPFDGHGREIADRVPHATVRMLPTAHLAPVERPEDFAATVGAFLSETSHA
jgi:3-oxoadipate enol-lactonase / 4-carboxymuconolactone decarboxylase